MDVTRIRTRTKLKKWLNGEEFYNLCQAYRLAPIADQRIVVKAFEDIKRRILQETRGPR